MLTCVLSISGMNCVPLVSSRAILPIKRSSAPTNTGILKRRAFRRIPPYRSFTCLNNLDSFSSVFFKTPADIIGTTVSATIRLAIREYPMVSPISTKSCLVIPDVNTIGRNTHTVVRVEAIIAPPTCRAPSIAAFLADSPSSLRIRYIFSITTMELSTSIPTPSARPDKEIMFNVTPEKYMATNAVIILIGIEQAITKVGRILFKNTRRIITASIAPYTRLLSTEWTIISI